MVNKATRDRADAGLKALQDVIPKGVYLAVSRRRMVGWCVEFYDADKCEPGDEFAAKTLAAAFDMALSDWDKRKGQDNE